MGRAVRRRTLPRPRLDLREAGVEVGLGFATARVPGSQVHDEIAFTQVSEHSVAIADTRHLAD